MSTKVSEIYDNIHVRLAALYPSSSRLPNPYQPEDNPEPYLKSGYGVRIGPGTNANRVIGCQISIDREFTVVLSKKVYAREADGANKGVTEKALMEDVFTLINDVERDGTLNGSVVNTMYVTDSGIQFVFGEKDQFVYTEVNLTSNYFETLS